MDSLSDYLEKKDDDLDDVLQRYSKKKQSDYKIKRLAFRLKKPGLSKLLGEENPMLSDELQSIRGMIKMTREDY